MIVGEGGEGQHTRPSYQSFAASNCQRFEIDLLSFLVVWIYPFSPHPFIFIFLLFPRVDASRTR